MYARLERLRQEYVVAITGTLRLREDPNPTMPTGLVELVPESMSVVNVVDTVLPFLVNDEEAPPREELRLRHRVLDLRYVLLFSVGDPMTA